MKKILALLLCSLFAISLMAGCSSSSATVTNSASPSSANDPAPNNSDATPGDDTPSSTPVEESNDPVTLRWAMWDYNATQYYKAIKNAYSLVKPNVTLEFVDLGSADFDASLTTQLVGGEIYDLVAIKDTPGYIALIDGEFIEDLTPYIASSPIPHATAYDDAYTLDGKLYQLSWRADPWVLFYNKTMFDTLNVNYPKLGITFSEYDALVNELGEALKSYTHTGDGFDYSNSRATFYHGWRSTIQLYACTTTGDANKLFSGGDYSYLQPYYDKILAQMDNGYALSWIDNTMGVRYDNNFVSQEFAMTPMGTWLVTNILSKPDYGTFEWGMSSYPVADGVTQRIAPATTTGISVTTASSHKDAAFAFAAWLGGPQGAATLASTGAFTAYVDDNTNDLLFSAKGFPTDSVSKQAVSPDKTFLEAPVIPNASSINSALDAGNNAILKEGKTIQEGLQMMQEGVDAALAE